MCRKVDLVSLAFDIIQSTLSKCNAHAKMSFFPNLLSLSKSDIFGQRGTEQLVVVSIFLMFISQSMNPFEHG